MELDGPLAWPKPCHPIWLQNHRKWSQLLGQMDHILGLSCPWRSAAVLCVLSLVKAWPHDFLFHPFWSSAGPAKGPTGRQFGSRVVQVWPKDHLKRPLLEKRDTSPEPCYLLGFVLFGWTLAGIGQLEGARGGLAGDKGPSCASIGAQRFNWDLWKRSQMDANGRERAQTRAGSEVKVYLKA